MVTLPEPLRPYLPEIAQIMRNPGLPIHNDAGNSSATLPVLGYCSLCVRPIEYGYSLCYPCHRAVGSLGEEMPDLVVPLTYAGATAQSRRDVYDYKGEPPNSAAVRRLTILIFFYVQLHSGCVRRQTGKAVTSVVSVPSGRNRNPHPLDQFLRYFPQELVKTTAIFTGSPRDGRAAGISPDDFGFTCPPAGDHVLILEDSWVSGSNAISLAVQAKRQGASHVSVVSIARYLSGDQVTSAWLQTPAAALPFDPLFCPVTRGECPPPLCGENAQLGWSARDSSP